MLPGVLWTQTEIPALVWWYSCQSEREKRKSKANHETEGKKTKSRVSIIRPGVSCFPLKLTKATKVMSDLVSWAPCWEGACVVVMVAIFSALVNKVAFEDSAGRGRERERSRMRAPEERSSKQEVCRSPTSEWHVWFPYHCLKPSWLEFLSKSSQNHSKTLYDGSHVRPHHPPPNRHPRKWTEKFAPEDASLKL